MKKSAYLLLLGSVLGTLPVAAQTTVYVTAVSGTDKAVPTPAPLYVETNPGVYSLGGADKVSLAGLDNTRGGSRLIREGATTVSGFTVTPTLVTGATYKVSFAAPTASRSGNLVVGITVTGATTTMPATSTAWRSGAANAGNWQDLGNITVNAGVTNPSIKFSYVSGTLQLAAPSQRFLSDAYRFEPIIVARPSINSQPQSITRNAGTSHTFTVGATGTAPLSYQWKFNGTNLTGATTSSYAISNIQTNHAGPYFVAVTNPGGTTNSSTATLTVTPVVPALSGPLPANRSVYHGSSVPFTVTATGSQPFSYQWQFNSTDIPGATLSAYTRANAQLAHSGDYRVIVTNYVGGTTSVVSTLIVTNDAPRFTTQPQPQTVNAGTTATFSVVAAGANPKTYQWHLESSPVSGATQSSYTINNVQQNVAGNYYVTVSNVDGSTNSSTALLTVTDTLPVITAEPLASQTIGSGSSATFSVATRGKDPRFYQWQFEGSDIAGATTPSYTRLNAQISHSGGYRVLVTNDIGSATSITANLTVTNSGPVILTHPQSVTTNAGTMAVFAVSAQGSALLYQWRLNGGDLAGATRSSYTNFNAQRLVSGNPSGGVYSVIVSNAQGVAISDDAELFVNDTVPIITTQPVATQSIQAGNSASFFVTTVGTDPRSYQWRFNGGDISGATTTSYTRSNAQLSHDGSYQVVISNSIGVVTSAVSQLTVIPPPPVITQQPQARTVPAGSNVTFTVTATSFIPMTYQWRFGVTPIAGATDSSYTRTNAQSASGGNYSVIVSNNTGFVTSSSALLTVTPSAPIVVQQPSDRTVFAGDTTTFTVGSLGTDPRSYQWRFNNADIAGATQSTYTLSDIQSTNGGNYAVRISNGQGNTTSSNALMSIIDSAPAITSQPEHRKVLAGSCATFSVAASGSKPMTFQWKHNGQPIPGAYDSTFSLYDIEPGFAGSLTVDIVNPLGNASSVQANLTVVTNPFFASFSRNGADVGLSWSTVPSKTYRLQYKDSLNDASWTTVGQDRVANDCTISVTDSNTPSRRFYRLVELP